MDNKLSVIIDTNVIVSALLSKYEDSATVKVLNLFYELVMDKNVDDGKLVTGNIKHFPKEKYIMTLVDFIKAFFE